MVPRMYAHTKTGLEKKLKIWVHGIVTTAEYNIVYNIVYIFLVHISVHLDMLNKIIVHLYSESMIVYIHGDTIFTSECSQTWCQSGWEQKNKTKKNRRMSSGLFWPWCCLLNATTVRQVFGVLISWFGDRYDTAMLERLRDILAFNKEIEPLRQMGGESCTAMFWHDIVRSQGFVWHPTMMASSTSDVMISAKKRVVHVRQCVYVWVL